MARIRSSNHPTGYRASMEDLHTLDNLDSLARALEEARVALYLASEAVGPGLDSEDHPVDIGLWIAFDVAWDRHRVALDALNQSIRKTA